MRRELVLGLPRRADHDDRKLLQARVEGGPVADERSELLRPVGEAGAPQPGRERASDRPFPREKPGLPPGPGEHGVEHPGLLRIEVAREEGCETTPEGRLGTGSPRLDTGAARSGAAPCRLVQTMAARVGGGTDPGRLPLRLAREHRGRGAELGEAGRPVRPFPVGLDEPVPEQEPGASREHHAPPLASFHGRRVAESVVRVPDATVAHRIVPSPSGSRGHGRESARAASRRGAHGPGTPRRRCRRRRRPRGRGAEKAPVSPDSTAAVNRSRRPVKASSGSLIGRLLAGMRDRALIVGALRPPVKTGADYARSSSRPAASEGRGSPSRERGLPARGEPRGYGAAGSSDHVLGLHFPSQEHSITGSFEKCRRRELDGRPGCPGSKCPRSGARPARSESRRPETGKPMEVPRHDRLDVPYETTIPFNEPTLGIHGSGIGNHRDADRE